MLATGFTPKVSNFLTLVSFQKGETVYFFFETQKCGKNNIDILIFIWPRQEVRWNSDCIV